jgi:hypothetical protein
LFGARPKETTDGNFAPSGQDLRRDVVGLAATDHAVREMTRTKSIFSDSALAELAQSATPSGEEAAARNTSQTTTGDKKAMDEMLVNEAIQSFGRGAVLRALEAIRELLVNESLDLGVRRAYPTDDDGRLGRSPNAYSSSEAETNSSDSTKLDANRA